MPRHVALLILWTALAAACSGTADPPVTTQAMGPAPLPTTTAADSPSPVPETSGPPATATTGPQPADPAPPAIAPDPEFVLRYAVPRPVDMRSNPFAPREIGEFPGVFAAHLYRVLPPTFTLVPELAADDEPPPTEFDGTGWVATVELNRGLTWSDGDPIDAFDVQFTFEDLVAFGDPDEHGWVIEDPRGTADLVDVAAIDDYTVQIKFSARPTIDRWHFGVATASILPEHYWAFTFATLADGNERDPDLGIDAPSAGGYRFGDAGSADEWQWVAVENWWNSGSSYTLYTTGAVRYRNDRLGIEETYGDVSVTETLGGWTEGPYAGRVLWFDASEKGGTQFAVDKGDAELAVGGYQPGDGRPGERAVPMRTSSDDLAVLLFDPAHPALSSSALRSALTCLITLDFLTEQVLQGSAVRSGWLPDRFAEWSWPERRRVGATFEPGPGGDPCPLPEEDRTAEAITRMRNLGWTWTTEPGTLSPSFGDTQRGEGLQHADGLATELRLVGPSPAIDPQGASAAAWVQVWLQHVGFDVDLEVGHTDELAQREWDVAVIRSEQTLPPRPLVAPSAALRWTHLEAAGVADAAEQWQIVSEELRQDALAMPMFVPVIVDWVSPDVAFPYESPVGGLDPSIIATAVQQP